VLPPQQKEEIFIMASLKWNDVKVLGWLKNKHINLPPLSPASVSRTAMTVFLCIVIFRGPPTVAVLLTETCL